MKSIQRFKANFFHSRYGNPSQKLRVIVVAGKVGKTTVAHFLYQILKRSGSGVTLLADNMSQNEQWQDYRSNLTSLQKALSHGVQQGNAFAIIEADENLVEMMAHTTFHVDTAVALSDCKYINQLLGVTKKFAVLPEKMQTPANLSDQNVMSFGKSDDAEMQLEDVKLYKKGTELTVRVDHHHQMQVATHLIGKHNAMNVVAALAALYVLSIDTDHFAEGVADLEEIYGNYQYLQNKPVTVAVDRAHRSDFITDILADSREITRQRLIVAMDAGVYRFHQVLNSQLADKYVVVGKSDYGFVSSASNPEEAVKLAHRACQKGDTILFLGEDFLKVNEDGRSVVQESL